MSSLFVLPAGRLAKWLVALVWLVVVVAVIAGNLPGKFADAEKNESTSFLPGDAESTKALDASKRITGGENVTAVVVYRREGGLTAGDRARIAADVAGLQRLRGQFPQLVAGPGGRVFRLSALSRDQTTALVTGDIRTDGEGSTIIDPVEAIRDRLGTDSARRDGLQVKVTGG